MLKNAKKTGAGFGNLPSQLQNPNHLSQLTTTVRKPSPNFCRIYATCIAYEYSEQQNMLKALSLDERIDRKT